MTKKIIPSALNYTGGKYKLLPQILPLFPKNIDKMVDMFCGGCNVGINVDTDNVLFNDSDSHLIGLLSTLKSIDKDLLLESIYKIINNYGLSNVAENGYAFYNCESSSGLGSFNKNGFNQLRADFNAKTSKDTDYYIMLYVIIVFAFNNQIRFNNKGEFNLPVGKRDFNKNMKAKLIDFIDRIKCSSYSFTNNDFRNIDISSYTTNSFFYADPPYLITCATYNEKNGWTENDEKDLLNFLENLDHKGIKFALSNVIEGNGKKNTILINWLAEHSNFKCIDLEFDYSNSNYHKKEKDSITKEVLIVNY
jgi:adenine-specific DNA-methyltransferase